MTKHQTKAFTLVELIIVITILAILATIGFMSYQSYTIDARDGKRVADLGQIRKGLEIYQTKNAKLPIPDEQITNIVNGGNLLGYQGYAGTNVLTKIRADRVKDPKDNISYTYSTNGDYTKFQLMSMLENGSIVNLSQIPVNTTYAADYTDRKTYVIGNKLGVFLNSSNTPIQETLSGNIDLGGAYSGTSFKVVFANTSTNSGVITGSGVSLYNNVVSIANIITQTQVIPVKIVTYNTGKRFEDGTYAVSCNGYRNPISPYTYDGVTGDGVYTIDPDGNGGNTPFDVYCDMITDGGGWTQITKIKSDNRTHVNTIAVNPTGLTTFQGFTPTLTSKLSDSTIDTILKSGENIVRGNCNNEGNVYFKINFTYNSTIESSMVDNAKNMSNAFSSYFLAKTSTWNTTPVGPCTRGIIGGTRTFVSGTIGTTSGLMSRNGSSVCVLSSLPGVNIFSYAYNIVSGNQTNGCNYGYNGYMFAK